MLCYTFINIFFTFGPYLFIADFDAIKVAKGIIFPIAKIGFYVGTFALVLGVFFKKRKYENIDYALFLAEQEAKKVTENKS